MKRGIAVAGNMTVDKILSIDRFPVRGELTKVRHIGESVGGAVCNVGIDLRALDKNVPVCAVGMVGLDGEGETILRRLKDAGIDVSRILKEGRTSVTDVLSEPDGVRTFLTFEGAGGVFDCRHVDADGLDCDIFHIGYMLLLPTLDSPDAEYGTRMARLLKTVRDRGILTSVDIVSESGDRYSTIAPHGLKYTDYLTINEIEAQGVTGVELRDRDGGLIVENMPYALKKLKEMGVSKRAIIHAPEGGFGLDENGEYVSQKSARLPKGFIKGSVGAGDAFCAGALLAAYNGQSLSCALRMGNASAICSLSESGATEGVRPIGEALKLLEMYE